MQHQWPLQLRTSVANIPSHVHQLPKHLISSTCSSSVGHQSKRLLLIHVVDVQCATHLRPVALWQPFRQEAQSDQVTSHSAPILHGEVRDELHQRNALILSHLSVTQHRTGSDEVRSKLCWHEQQKHGEAARQKYRSIHTINCPPQSPPHCWDVLKFDQSPSNHTKQACLKRPCRPPRLLPALSFFPHLSDEPKVQDGQLPVRCAQ